MNKPIDMDGCITLAANMMHSARNGESVELGSGIFTPEELANGAIALRLVPELVAALEKIDANAAESPVWIRRVARAVLAKATGETK